MRPLLLLPLLAAFLLISCGGASQSQQEDLLKSAKKSGSVMGHFHGEIEDLKLELAELPSGWTFTNDLSCPSSQVRLLYEKPEMFKGSMQVPTQKEYQTVIGPDGTRGSILYMQYPNKVTETESGFLAGILWGAGKRDKGPTAEHPEDYLNVDKTVVIWCLPPGHPVKTLSQDKVRRVIDEHR